MITYSIIQKSKLEGALRLDAEYYQPEFLGLVKNLNILGAVAIKDFAVNPKRKFNPKKDEKFQYIEISEVDLSTGEYKKVEISGENAPDRAQWIVKKGDVIISTVRPIRNAISLIREDTKNLVCSSGFAVLKTEKIEPEYLFVYLKSRPIVKLLDRKTTATMYPAITIEDLLQTGIYLGDQKFRNEIVDKTKKAQKELENSKSLHSQAENLLLDELGLKDFEIGDDLSYIVSLSDVKSAHRVDAEYFQPKYDKLISKIKNQNAKLIPLNDIFSLRRGNFINPDYYIGESKRGYIRIKELPTKGDINLDAITYIDDSFSGQNLETLKEGDFVFAGIGATLGKTARIPRELEGSFYSNNTGRFRLKKNWEDKIESYYLQVVFQSIVCQWQFEQKQAQTAQAKIADEELRTVLIPILPKSTQQKIADLAQKSHEARRKAKQLLEQAKQKVEELISN